MNGEPGARPSTTSPPAVREKTRLPWSEADTIGQIRLPGALPLVVAGGVLSGLLMLWLTRRYDFYFDEWSYVLYVRNFSVGDYFVPHNEHWATIPALTYRLLLLLFSARSYLPYMAVLAAWNLLTALFLFLLIRRRSGEVLGLAAAALFLVLGRGWENLIWADQIGFVGSSALGLLAILLLTGPSVSRWRGWAGSAALIGALMTQGPALFFLAWLIVELALDRTERRRLLYLVLPIAGYLVWFVIIGHTTITGHQSPFALSTWVALLPYVATGIGASAAGVVGLGLSWAPVGAIVFGGIVGLAWARGRPDWGLIAAAAGLVAEFVIIGLVRSSYGDADAGSPRYVDIAAIFILVLLADAVSHLRWRSPAAAGALAVVLIGLLLSGVALHQAAGDHYLGEVLPGEVSEQVAWAYRDSPGLDQSLPVDPAWLPAFSVQSYVAAREVQGSALPNLTPDQLGRYPAALVDRSLGYLFPPHLSVATAAPGEVCTPESVSGLTAAAGSTVTFRSDQAGPVVVQVWHYGPIPASTVAQATLTSPGQALTVRAGTPEPGFTWSLRVVGAPYSVVSVCSSP